MTRTDQRIRRRLHQETATLLRQAEALAEENRRLAAEARRLRAALFVRAVEDTAWDCPEAEVRFALSGRTP